MFYLSSMKLSLSRAENSLSEALLGFSVSGLNGKKYIEVWLHNCKSSAQLNSTKGLFLRRHLNLDFSGSLPLNHVVLTFH